MSVDLLLSFQDERSAYSLVEAYAWPEGPVCPHCGGRRRIGALRGRSTQIGTYKCYHCRKLFTVKWGTIFESSHVPLHKWIQAIYLTGCGTEEMKPHELSEVLNVTFKTAAFIMSRIRCAAIESGLLSTKECADAPPEAPARPARGRRSRPDRPTSVSIAPRDQESHPIQ
jgi:transposase-like protein